MKSGCVDCYVSDEYTARTVSEKFISNRVAHEVEPTTGTGFWFRFSLKYKDMYDEIIAGISGGPRRSAIIGD